MSEVDSVSPTPPYPGVRPDERGRERRRDMPAQRKVPATDQRPTDDAGETSEEKPIVDDYA